MNNHDFFLFIKNEISKKNAVMLCCVLHSKNSSPGKAGFKMAVGTENTYGSIGGGTMEFNIVNECKRYLSSGTKVHFIKELKHYPVKDKSSGLICAGSQTISITLLNQSHFEIINSIIESFESSIPKLLCINNDGLMVCEKDSREINFEFAFYNENYWHYREMIGISETIYVVGGGHVGLALSKIMKLLDFKVILIDDREHVPTLEMNYSADKIININFDMIDTVIEEGKRNYAVILTHSHESDAKVLSRLINKRLAYIGLMGSDAKIKTTFLNLIENGVSEEQLKRVNAPVGLFKCSKPIEIAVSIAAEIIKIKSET